MPVRVRTQTRNDGIVDLRDPASSSKKSIILLFNGGYGILVDFSADTFSISLTEYLDNDSRFLDSFTKISDRGISIFRLAHQNFRQGYLNI